MAFLSGLLQFVQSNVVAVIATLLVIIGGFMMSSMRSHPMALLALVAGIWVASNADTVVGFLAH